MGAVELTDDSEASRFARMDGNDSRHDAPDRTTDAHDVHDAHEAHEAHSPRPQGTSSRAALVGLIICVALIGGGLLLIHKLKAMSELQDCLMQGRTNCAPVDAGG